MACFLAYTPGIQPKEKLWYASDLRVNIPTDNIENIINVVLQPYALPI